VRTLVLGGIRSGKSRYAEQALLAEAAVAQPAVYVAPGPTGSDDTEWARRIAEHRGRRPAHWSTVETDDVAAQLRGSPRTPTLVDDLGTWLTGALDRHHAWDDGSVEDSVQGLVDSVDEFSSALVLVSPEVGLTVIPATAAGRRFADELGVLNQRVAAVCDRVVLVVAGQPVPIKANEASA
jgi:adenosylcobinamide kinase / adenosylcobinamide-phosphate guanylyltransferase